MIIDDDLMSREVLCLLAQDAGFEVAPFESGEAALESLASADSSQPDVILADMQMPGLAGDKLADALRAALPTGRTILAMSGSPVSPDATSAFDGFLLKPFSMQDVIAILDSTAAPSPGQMETTDHSGALSRSIYDSFAKSMTPEQVRQLYTMSLDDADARIGTMQQALDAGDGDAYRRAAHSIKGGCGMVGAVELASLASEMEEKGPGAVDNSGPLKQFLSASARLRRILKALQP